MRSGRFQKIEQICNPIFFKGKNMNTLHLFAKTFLLVSLLVSSTAFATTYYIDTDGNDLNAGTSWAMAFKTIQRGVNVSANGDIVEVNEGTYYCTVSNNKTITITSTNPDNWDVVKNTVIDANRATTAVSISAGTMTGFTVRNASQEGVYTNNSAITNCIIKNNGYLGLCGGSGSIISHNIVYGASTGVHLSYLFDNVSVINNVIYNSNYGIYFVENYAIAYVKNNTIVGCYYGICGFNPDQNISNCIIWDCNDDLVDCAAIYSCISDSFDANDPNFLGSISSDPCFVDADANDFHLKLNSPCINAGDPNFNDVNEVDIDGDPRIMNARVDMGADESTDGDILFRIRDDEGNDVARIDSLGNMALKGILSQNSTVYATTAKEFRFINTTGNDLAIINAANGNMRIDGTLYQNQTTLAPVGNNKFIVKNSSGTIVAYIDNNGNLCLKGNLFNIK
jgi:hypothetical protein